MNPTGFRGRGRGRGNGYDFQAGGASRETDALYVRVTELRQPVTEDIMHKVFGSISLTPRRMQFMPSDNASESVFIVQFADTYSATRAMEQLNTRNIYNDGNKMTMSYVNWESFAPSQQQQAVFAMGQTPSAPAYGMQQMPNPYGAGVMPGMTSPSVQPSVYGAGGAQTMTPPMAGGQYPPQYGAYGAQASAAQSGVPIAIGGGAGGSMGMPGAMGMAAGNPLAMGMQGAMGMAAMTRGGRGRGRGGAMTLPPGFNPMMMGGMMPYGMVPTQTGAGTRNSNLMPTIFLSITVVPETEPLISIFQILESYGGVVTIRRNHNKKEILTVKMASIPEADNVIEYMRRIPFCGGTISAKRFPNYVERSQCTDDGDPTDPATTQYDFTTARHRSPAQRTKFQPSTLVKITGCNSYSEADLMTYFTGKNFFPERITQEEDGSFVVQTPDAETSIRLLIACQGNVCGEEKSNVIFMEGPKAETEEGAAPAKSGEESNAKDSVNEA